MTEVGLNENLAIVIDYHELGKRGVQRYLIEKNNPVLIYQDARNVDSGDANTLIDFVRWGVATFDAENYGLVVWDHATSGFLDPNLSRSIEQAELYGYPPLTNDLASLTPVGLPDFLMQELEKKLVKGSCFDDAYRSYINNQNLEISLETIHNDILHGKLWEFIGFDTCLQADIATACYRATICTLSCGIRANRTWKWMELLSNISSYFRKIYGFARARKTYCCEL